MTVDGGIGYTKEGATHSEGTAKELLKPHVASQPWWPQRKTSPNVNEGVRRKILAILNKVTPQRCDNLLKRLRKLVSDCEDQQHLVLDLLIEKAGNDSKYAATYAWMCFMLVDTFETLSVRSVSGTSLDRSPASFRSLLNQKVEREFKRNKEGIRGGSTTDERHDPQDGLPETSRARLLNVVYFTNELHRFGMMTFDFVNEILSFLMKDTTDEEFLVAASDLLKTVGAQLADQYAKQDPTQPDLQLQANRRSK